MKAELTFLYVPNDSMGYGRMGVRLHEALTANGVDVFTHHGTDPTPEDRTAKQTNVVMWASVPTHADGWWASQHSAIFTMYEATVLPEEFRASLHNFDTVLVPSDQNVDLFSQWHPNVQRVLLGVDPTQWYYRERKPPGTFFDFLIGGSGPRKGLDVAYEAFVKAFPKQRTDGPIPRLTFKSPKGAGWPSPLESRYESPNFSDPSVQVVSGKISSEAEQDLYANAHCYLQPSRGEGFGLQPLQALAQGLPTILTDAHGHESFAHLGHGVSTKLSPAEYFIYGNPPDMQWWEPNVDEFVDLMRWVYDNYDEATEKARTAARVICRHFTWRNTAEQIRGIFGDLLTTPFTESEWREIDQKKFPMRVKDPTTCDVAGVTWVFQPGEEYWVTADVKRILYEAGRLDSGSAEHDAGLTDEQIAKTNRDGNLFCPTCHQQFGSGLSRTDFELGRSA